MLTKLKKAVGIISSAEYTAITAVDHFNQLIQKHNELAMKYMANEDSFKRDVIADLLENTLNAITEQATMIVVLLEEPNFKNSFSKIMANRTSIKEKNNIQAMMYLFLSGEMDTKPFFVDEEKAYKLADLERAFKWIDKVITPKYKDKMIWHSFSKALTTIDSSAPKSSIVFTNKLIAKMINLISSDLYELDGDCSMHLALLKLNTKEYKYHLPPLIIDTYMVGYIQLLDSINKTLEVKQPVKKAEKKSFSQV